jgi:hypothetical protein
MVNDGARIDWSVRVLRNDDRLANYLCPVLACARDSANGLRAAYRVQSHRGTFEHALEQRSLDEEAHRQAGSWGAREVEACSAADLVHFWRGGRPGLHPSRRGGVGGLAPSAGAGAGGGLMQLSCAVERCDDRQVSVIPIGEQR